MKTLIGALSLLATGVVIGVLVAPDKGKKTREKINDKFGDLKDNINRFRGTTMSELDELKAAFKNEAAGLKEDTRQRVLDLIKAAKATKNHIKDEVLS